MKGIDMANGTCSLRECDSKVRARGLCSTHYNHAHQPDRHRKVEVACGYCGEPCMKESGAKFQARFCSLICRDLWRKDGWAYSATESVVLLRSFQSWRRTLYAELRPLSLPVLDGECAECAVTFPRWRADHRYCSDRCKHRARQVRRRAREHNAPGTYTWAEVMHLFLLFDRCCAYCERPVIGQPDPDHVVPLSRGGLNSITNILPTCHACNSGKRNLLLDEWAADRARRGLMPVTTSWSVDDLRVRHLTTVSNWAQRAA